MVLSDIEIANSVTMEPISKVADQLGIDKETLCLYGKYKAKIDARQLVALKDKPDGKLILVTAISPTPAGEGKTTTSVGLVDALSAIGKKAVIALREPSLGPVFGVKGGAAGGGHAQVVPMEDINLHFTGDFHAIGVANNLLAALIDNHIHHGNSLGIDSRRITWKRVVDMNDRQLRHIVDGLQGKVNGVPREDGYDITVASEIMAILCLSENISDLKARLEKIIIGYNFQGEPVTAKDLKYGDYAVTEAGFGADLGAEKFIDIKCRMSGLRPAAVVLVATIRALKMHGGVPKADLATENVQAVVDGLPNLDKHLANIQDVYGLPVVVAINKFPLDTDAELQAVYDACDKRGVDVVISDVWANGGAGGRELAEKVVALAEQDNQFRFVYNEDDSIETKLTKIVTKIYGGKGIKLTPTAKRELAELERLGFGNYPICMAKTQYSFSDDAKKLGAPTDFIVTISNLKVSAGAGFIVALTGAIMTMPGLPKVPASETIDIDEEGNITGLF
ncbi:TPA: formate--tetrahydrofolate ligase [Streptococcus pyogenes]|nr:formate--tetrahydrofolate ligase [Streptococcus pyogenes]HEQ5281268.1 formate--tetrahydrofolate ligase [Streptococcus pyogenes]HEQ5288323.1 formate--tetrahydrofolate ligase [Streptococcus pyogenes]HEQ5298878.1 formate--tetrahydrofolate ligase [Streptococcus pyogenes]HEQ5300550.1 formate--tetrahydrofolate ligase [Streptococcus pyogenes]